VDAPVRVATFNIRHGARADGTVDHGALVRTCAELDADILGLQEVEARHLRTRFRHQSSMLARRLGYSFAYAPIIRSGLGRYGNALLARGVIRDVEALVLPRPTPRQPRGAVVARVALDALEATVAVTHLQHRRPGEPPTTAEAPQQLGWLLDTLAARPAPRILLGDLNLGAPRATAILAQAGFHTAAHEPTFPSERPRVVLDYVAVQGLDIVAYDVAPTHTSDHRAVVATVVGG
jgi:endonuclease/exonuclease/phosphatase family metal-dependent hydrolase